MIKRKIETDVNWAPSSKGSETIINTISFLFNHTDLSRPAPSPVSITKDTTFLLQLKSPWRIWVSQNRAYTTHTPLTATNFIRVIQTVFGPVTPPGSRNAMPIFTAKMLTAEILNVTFCNPTNNRKPILKKNNYATQIFQRNTDFFNNDEKSFTN